MAHSHGSEDGDEARNDSGECFLECKMKEVNKGYMAFRRVLDLEVKEQTDSCGGVGSALPFQDQAAF